MGPAVLVGVIGFIVLVLLCFVSAYASWQTRRLMMTVFGENPRQAQLSQRGYYLRLPEAPPVAAPPCSSDARALAPAVEPAPESTRKPGSAPSSRKRPAVTALAAEPGILAAGLGERPRETRSELPPPQFIRKAMIVGIQPPSVASPPILGAVSARPLPAVTSPPVRAVQSSHSALAASVAVAARIVSANGGDNAEGATTVARPDPLPTATTDGFESDDEATKVMDLPTAEELALDKQRARSRAKTLVSASAGVPSSHRPVPDVQVIGANTPPSPGDTSAPVEAH